jgi:hypothetical protein
MGGKIVPMPETSLKLMVAPISFPPLEDLDFSQSPRVEVSPPPARAQIEAPLEPKLHEPSWALVGPSHHGEAPSLLGSRRSCAAEPNPPSGLILAYPGGARGRLDGSEQRENLVPNLVSGKSFLADGIGARETTLCITDAPRGDIQPAQVMISGHSGLDISSSSSAGHIISIQEVTDSPRDALILTHMHDEDKSNLPDIYFPGLEKYLPDARPPPQNENPEKIIWFARGLQASRKPQVTKECDNDCAQKTLRTHYKWWGKPPLLTPTLMTSQCPHLRNMPNPNLRKTQI